MTTYLEFDNCSAALYDDGKCLRAFGWPRDGGHVWETVQYGADIKNVSVCYHQSTSTILTEKEPIETAKHIAKICGVANKDIIER